MFFPLMTDLLTVVERIKSARKPSLDDIVIVSAQPTVIFHGQSCVRDLKGPKFCKIRKVYISHADACLNCVHFCHCPFLVREQILIIVIKRAQNKFNSSCVCYKIRFRVDYIRQSGDI